MWVSPLEIGLIFMQAQSSRSTVGGTMIKVRAVGSDETLTEAPY